MVTAKPQLGDALETMIIGNHLWNKMTMIINDRHLGSVIVVQVLSHLGLENEVIVIKLFHNVVICFRSSQNFCKDSKNIA
jgi:hypothetical protein